MKPKNMMQPIHPGEILREEFLVPLNMSAHALSLPLILIFGSRVSKRSPELNSRGCVIGLYGNWG